jgi:hypothetical protein
MRWLAVDLMGAGPSRKEKTPWQRDFVEAQARRAVEAVEPLWRATKHEFLLFDKAQSQNNLL